MNKQSFLGAGLEASAEKAAALLRAMSNARRLMILCELAEGERCVGQIHNRAGLSQSALSQHLAVLREQGLVATRRKSQAIFYRIADPAMFRIIDALASNYCAAERPDQACPQVEHVQRGSRRKRKTRSQSVDGVIG